MTLDIPSSPSTTLAASGTVFRLPRFWRAAPLFPLAGACETGFIEALTGVSSLGTVEPCLSDVVEAERVRFFDGL